MAIEKRLEDQILYEIVLDELEAGKKIKGLWAKAYANAGGENNRVEPLYMQYRVQSIKDLFTSMKIIYDELSKNEIQEYMETPELFTNRNKDTQNCKNDQMTKDQNVKVKQANPENIIAFAIGIVMLLFLGMMFFTK